MIRILTLGVVFVAMGALYYVVNAPKVEPKRSLDGWNMQQEFQSASDYERNPWKRTNQ